MRKRYEIRDLRKTKSLPAALDLIRQAFKSVGSRAQTSGEEVLKALLVLMSHARAGSS